MSFIKIWVHCVWTTKNRIPFLKNGIREKVLFHIIENARSKGIYIDHINGYNEHLHALISLGGKQSISELMQKIKGESSFWINKHKLTCSKFEWQDDFYSVSVGMEQVDILIEYIRSQAEHHAIISFEEELDKIIEEYNLKKTLD
jgi:REP element-mobilizing transposase RayT